MGNFGSIEAVWHYLDNIPMFSKVGAKAGNFSLDNIRMFCEAMGDPQQNFSSIHVAGTNGKGTTCFLLEGVYKQGGYKTGTFISPHLLRYNERFRINGKDAEDEDILRFFQTNESLLDKIPLSYFEISTALAFWLFAENEVDIAIIETGLGGRLDATNIIEPECSVITSIGMDHTDILGNTIEQICREKAGIIKRVTPIVYGDLPESCEQIILKTAESRNSKVYSAQALSPKWNEGKVQLAGFDFTFDTHLAEPINRWNIAMVAQVVKLLQAEFELPESTLKQGIESIQRVPGRFEKLRSDREWYFSGSHNLQALASLKEGLDLIKSQHRVVVFSIMRDKISDEVLTFFSSFDQRYYYEMDNDRAAGYDEISGYLEVQKMDEFNHSVILNELKASLVIFTGSFYFYPIVKQWS
tara:strand:- start:124028 stop:125266 length:1239 start_codon:yes stop_codon:yes gene_type:complete